MDNSAIERLVTEAIDAGPFHFRSRRRGHLAERVLSAHVLQALDFLPRTTFLGRVLLDATGADAARAAVLAEVEDLSILFLPELRADSDARARPDAWISGPTTACLVDTKAPRSTFGRRQLCSDYRSLLKHAGERLPLMLLIVEDPERVTVWGRPGSHTVIDAVRWELEQTPGEAVSAEAGGVVESRARTAASLHG